MSRTLAIFLLGAVVAACTPGHIDRVGVDSSYPAQQYQFVPYTKAMKLDVSGSLFGMEQAAFNQLVSDAIQPPGVIESDSSPYRVHIAFNGARVTGQNIACGASGAQSAPNGGDVWIVAALCPGSGPALTYLSGSVSDITGPADPRFRQFLRNAVVQLFPRPSNDDRNDRDNCILPGC